MAMAAQARTGHRTLALRPHVLGMLVMLQGVAGCTGDQAPPLISGGPEGIEANTDPASAKAFVSWPELRATDAVDGSLPVRCSPAQGEFPAGSTEVRCTAEDAAGNVATHTFVVHVADVAAPEFRAWPTALTAEATEAGTARLWWPAPKVEDRVSGTLEAHCSPAPGSDFPLGETLVSCCARDAAGNEATLLFPVRVTKAGERASDRIWR